MTGYEAASFTPQLLHTMLQVPLMTLSLAQYQCRRAWLLPKACARLFSCVCITPRSQWHA
jgi:hypothetical protein